jgi:hypothetical protein
LVKKGLFSQTVGKHVFMVNAAHFMDTAKEAEGGYQGLSIADQIDRLHEDSIPT